MRVVCVVALFLPACGVLFSPSSEQQNPEDAGVDSGVPALDAALPCPSDFCADFESESVLDDWTIPEVLGTGKVMLGVDAMAPSPSGIFLSSLSVPPPTSSYHAARLSYQESILDYEFMTPQLKLAFSFRVDEFIDNAGVTIAGLRYGAQEHYVLVAINPDHSSIDRVEVNYFFAPQTTPQPIGSVAIGEWVDFAINIPLRMGLAGALVGGGVTFVLDDTPVTGMLPPAAMTNALRFDVGLATTSPDSHTALVAYDAVRIDFR